MFIFFLYFSAVFLKMPKSKILYCFLKCEEKSVLKMRDHAKYKQLIWKKSQLISFGATSKNTASTELDKISKLGLCNLAVRNLFVSL